MRETAQPIRFDPAQSDSIRPEPAWEQSTDGTNYTDCTSGVIGFHPTQSDSIRPEPGDPDRMKPIMDCNCTMAGAAKVAASLRDAIHCHHRLASRSDAATITSGPRHGVTRLLCKTNPNRDGGQNRKTSFFHGNTNISIRSRPGDETFFYETNPNREKPKPASTNCKSVTYMKILWHRLTLLKAKRTQMRRSDDAAGRPAHLCAALRLDWRAALCYRL
jgi:hypothetical protein